MIVKKSTVWGTITGKLSLTKEQAKEMFDFDMHPDAIAVVLQHDKWGNLIIRNLFPRSPDTSKKLINWRKEARGFFLILHPLKSLIREVWNPLALQLHAYSGTALFRKINIPRWKSDKRVFYRWTKLLLTKGTLQTPSARVLYKRKIFLYNYNSSYQLGAILLELNTKKFFFQKPITLNSNYFLIPDFNLSIPFVLYLYYKKQNLYSDSSALIIRK